MNSALVVEVTRGDQIESRHEVDAVVVDPSGCLVGSWGEPHRAVLPSVFPVKPRDLVQATAGAVVGITR